MVQNREFDQTRDYITPEGEVVFNGLPSTAVIQTKDSIGPLLDNAKVPIHIAKMRELGITPEVMASYVNVTWSDIKPYLNKIVKIIGAAIWFSGEFEPQARPGTVESGYYKVLFKIEETKTLKNVPVGDRLMNIE